MTGHLQAVSLIFQRIISNFE